MNGWCILAMSNIKVCYSCSGINVLMLLKLIMKKFKFVLAEEEGKSLVLLFMSEVK